MEAKYMCGLCGRDKFTRKTSHYCIGGYRKYKIKWIELKPLNNVIMMQIIEMTKEQKIEMYMKLSKHELIEMLIENQRILELLTPTSVYQPHCEHYWIKQINSTSALEYCQKCGQPKYVLY